MKAYIASGFFNEQQKLDLLVIKQALINTQVNFFSPMDESLITKNSTEADYQATFDNNIREIVKCDVVICNTRDKDIGSIFEAGVAFMCNKPIVYYFSGDKTKFNLMLSHSGRAVASNLLELMECLELLKNNINWGRAYRGEIE